MGTSREQELFKAPPIGSMLIAGDIINNEDLTFALEHQKYSKTLIGDILVRMGAVDREELERVLDLQKMLSTQ